MKLHCLVPAFLLCFACVPEQKAVDHNPYIITAQQKPWIIAHGGAKQLWPENTYLAFKGSDSIGVDALEMDVNLTKDGILVLHHDETIDRMSDGSGKVIDYSFEELQQFNFGAGFTNLDGKQPYANKKVIIWSLEQLMLEFPDKQMVIEIKNEGENGKKAADELLRLLEVYGRKSYTIIASFHDEVLNYLLDKTDGTYFISTAQHDAKKLVIATKSGFGVLYRPHAVATQLPTESSGFNLAKKRMVKATHRHNMAVHYWTINDKVEMKQLIEAGADGLITDRPDLMHEVLKEMNLE